MNVKFSKNLLSIVAKFVSRYTDEKVLSGNIWGSLLYSHISKFDQNGSKHCFEQLFSKV